MIKRKQRKFKPSDSYEYTEVDGFKEAQKLSSYLGKKVKTNLITDKGISTYLIGLQQMEGVEGWSEYWYAKVRCWSNGERYEHWVGVKGVKPIKQRQNDKKM